MILTEHQQTVLLALTTDWQTPIQLASKFSNGNVDDVNQALKCLLNKGYVQVNPIVFGTYRLTQDGSTGKGKLKGE